MAVQFGDQRRAARWLTLMLAAALGVAAPPAQAQDRWAVTERPDTGRVSAVNCPITEAATGRYICFGLGCRPGGAMRWYLSAASEALPEVLRTTLAVEAGAPITLAMTRLGRAGEVDYGAPVAREAHAPVIAALKAGQAAELVIGTDTPAVAVSLRGSAEAIGEVEARCPLAPPGAVPDPARSVMAEIEALCTTLGGRTSQGEGFRRRLDLDGDGTQDLVINHGAALCSEAASLACGSAGCVHSLWRAVEGGYTEMLRQTVYDILPMDPAGFVLQVHGSFCSLPGLQVCELRYAVEDGALRRID